jgi:hypothetical protein
MLDAMLGTNPAVDRRLAEAEASPQKTRQVYKKGPLLDTEPAGNVFFPRNRAIRGTGIARIPRLF